MPRETADVVLCGAGIAGISAAYHLARRGIRDLILVDPLPPLSLTSDKSAECYRNWWPGAPMVAFMNRSIDLLEELAAASDDAFALNRWGYAYLTASAERAASLAATAGEISAAGGGPLRVHAGGPGGAAYIPPAEDPAAAPAGADLLLDAPLIHERFPFVAADTLALLHARRCGWLSAQQLGMLLLEGARVAGARLRRGEVTGVELAGGRVAGVRIAGPAGEGTVATRCLVLAPGPHLAHAGRLLGLDLPVFNELHGKVTFDDHLGIVPRDLPLMIWTDPVRLSWTDEERREIAADPEMGWLLDELPSGVHFRPEGGPDSRTLLLLWTYDLSPREPAWPPVFDPLFPQVVLRGVARMVPGLAAYFERFRVPFVDGGYYCKTPENRPLIGPLPVAGSYVFGALSGYGIMASQAGGELLAAHVAGDELPTHAPAFALARYEDPGYRAWLEHTSATAGQL